MADNYLELFTNITKALDKSIATTQGILGSSILKEEIDLTLYSNPDKNVESSYINTYAFRDASSFVNEKTLNGYNVYIGNDTSLMGYEYPSFIEGGDFRYMMGEWLNNGTNNSPIYNHPAYGFYTRTLSRYIKEYRPILISELKKWGISSY